MGYKRCKNCNRSFPEHLVEDHKLILKSPICPICARYITNKMKGNKPGTPFEKHTMHVDWLEAEHFIKFQVSENWGGHMINPPEDCSSSFMDNETGIFWVDLGICNINCKSRCPRYYEFRRLDSEEKREELHSNGVIRY